MDLAGKNILVTGGTGFIGSHLVKSLIAKNCKVVICYQDIDPRSFFIEQGLDKTSILASCDVKNFKRVFSVITKYEIDFIFHLAAQAVVTLAYYNPVETFETNILGTVNVLEAARQYGKVGGLLVTSSDKAYGKIPRASEKTPLSGDHPYETSKSAADLISTSYFKTYGLPIVVTRFGNVYGEGDLNFNRIIPGIMKSLILNEELLIRSDGKYVRDYVYVGDIIDAVMMLAKHIKKLQGEAFNISSSENLSVIELIKRVEGVLDRKVLYKILNQAINEIPKQSIDYQKIRKRLSWRPKNNINKVMPEVFEWYKLYFGRASV